jgi:hypothetical protein
VPTSSVRGRRSPSNAEGSTTASDITDQQSVALPLHPVTRGKSSLGTRNRDSSGELLCPGLPPPSSSSTQGPLSRREEESEYFELDEPPTQISLFGERMPAETANQSQNQGIQGHSTAKSGLEARNRASSGELASPSIQQWSCSPRNAQPQSYLEGADSLVHNVTEQHTTTFYQTGSRVKGTGFSGKSAKETCLATRKKVNGDEGGKPVHLANSFIDFGDDLGDVWESSPKTQGTKLMAPIPCIDGPSSFPIAKQLESQPSQPLSKEQTLVVSLDLVDQSSNLPTQNNGESASEYVPPQVTRPKSTRKARNATKPTYRPGALAPKPTRRQQSSSPSKLMKGKKTKRVAKQPFTFGTNAGFRPRLGKTIQPAALEPKPGELHPVSKQEQEAADDAKSSLYMPKTGIAKAVREKPKLKKTRVIPQLKQSAKAAANTSLALTIAGSTNVAQPGTQETCATSNQDPHPKDNLGRCCNQAVRQFDSSQESEDRAPTKVVDDLISILDENDLQSELPPLILDEPWSMATDLPPSELSKNALSVSTTVRWSDCEGCDNGERQVQIASFYRPYQETVQAKRKIEDCFPELLCSLSDMSDKERTIAPKRLRRAMAVDITSEASIGAQSGKGTLRWQSDREDGLPQMEEPQRESQALGRVEKGIEKPQNLRRHNLASQSNASQDMGECYLAGESSSDSESVTSVVRSNPSQDFVEFDENIVEPPNLNQKSCSSKLNRSAVKVNTHSTPYRTINRRFHAGNSKPSGVIDLAMEVLSGSSSSPDYNKQTHPHASPCIPESPLGEPKRLVVSQGISETQLSPRGEAEAHESSDSHAFGSLRSQVKIWKRRGYSPEHTDKEIPNPRERRRSNVSVNDRGSPMVLGNGKDEVVQHHYGAPRPVQLRMDLADPIDSLKAGQTAQVVHKEEARKKLLFPFPSQDKLIPDYALSGTTLQGNGAKDFHAWASEDRGIPNSGSRVTGRSIQANHEPQGSVRYLPQANPPNQTSAAFGRNFRSALPLTETHRTQPRTLATIHERTPLAGMSSRSYTAGLSQAHILRM